MISEVDETEIFKICIEYWNHLAAELYRESPFAQTSPLLISKPYEVPLRRNLYNPVLSKVLVVYRYLLCNFILWFTCFYIFETVNFCDNIHAVVCSWLINYFISIIRTYLFEIFLLILKQILWNYLKILKKCFFSTACIVMFYKFNHIMVWYPSSKIK